MVSLIMTSGTLGEGKESTSAKKSLISTDGLCCNLGATPEREPGNKYSTPLLHFTHFPCVNTSLLKPMVGTMFFDLY